MIFRKACMKTTLLACAAGLLMTNAAIGQPAQKDTVAPVKAVAVEKPLKPQTTCPVMGGDIDKSLYVDYKGKRIYVCCEGCLAKLKKNPEKYIKKLEKMGQTPDAVPPDNPQ